MFKYNKLVSILCVSLICFFISVSYSGFCFKKMRFLSEDEKIKIAIAEINQMGNVNFAKQGDTHNYKLTRVIPYKSVKDFLEENPDCCHVVPYAGFGGFSDPFPPTFFERLCGMYNSAVRVSYKFNFKEVQFDAQGEVVNEIIKSEIRVGDYHMDNCGRSTNTLVSEIGGKYYMKIDWNK